MEHGLNDLPSPSRFPHCFCLECFFPELWSYSSSARAVRMSCVCLDFAKCECGHSTPIRPTRIAPPSSTQTKTGAGPSSVFVACAECKQVFEADEPEPRPSMKGISPYSSDAPLHVFSVSLRCKEPDCKTPLVVLAVRNRDTSSEEIRGETAAWTWEGLVCPSGHWLPDHPPQG